MSDQNPIIHNSASTENCLGRLYNCILFNDEVHSMDEVTLQIMKAITCTLQEAMNIMLEAHKNGRAVVCSGHKERCEHAAAVLEEIRLSTKVEPAA